MLEIEKPGLERLNFIQATHRDILFYARKKNCQFLSVSGCHGQFQIMGGEIKRGVMT